MKLTVVSTGSKANAYILEAQTGILLLDAGLPFKKILPYVSDVRKVEGCLVTHSHQDHASGVNTLIHHGIDVYMSEGEKIDGCSTVYSKKEQKIGAFDVLPFSVEHDTPEPLGFLIRHRPTNETLLYATDTAYLRWTFVGVNYWLIECNYCDDILDDQLQSGEISRYLYERLRKSHMSLDRLKKTLGVNDLSQTRKIILAHLSSERSDAKRMVKEIHDYTGIETETADNGKVINLELTPF